MRAAGAFMLFATVMPVAAEDITRNCFPEFCIESREAFTAFNRQPSRGIYLMKVSRTQTNIYVQVGQEARFPACGALCRVDETGNEKRAVNLHTKQVIGRLVGPLSPCGGGSPYYVHLFAYDLEANLDAFSVVRECK